MEILDFWEVRVRLAIGQKCKYNQEKENQTYHQPEQNNKSSPVQNEIFLDQCVVNFAEQILLIVIWNKSQILFMQILKNIRYNPRQEQSILFLNTQMKSLLFLLLLLVSSLAQAQPDQALDTRMRVGQIVPGTINPEVTNQKVHPIYIEQVEKKYLFIRLSTFDTNMAAIGLYTNMTGELIFSCMNNTFDTCYVPADLLTPNKQFIILVMSNSPIKYNIYTYWGDLQHLKPDQQIKFMFDERDKTQLFHLDLENAGDFSQIRITLRPETIRTQGDSLKIFANKGNRQQPTQQKHDYESIHVWNDVQAIFISKDEVKDQKSIQVYIVGNAKTVYIMTCEFVRKDHHNILLNENVYEYINKQQQAVYHMKFDNKSNIDVYVVRFSVFTGEVEVGFYYDKQMNNFFKKLPYQYMSDIQFHIEKSDLQAGTQELYMKVRAQDTAACTFQINLQGRKKVESFEMYENLFQFVPIREKVQSMHIYSHIWNQNQFAAQKVQTFDISMIRVEGDTNLEFYKCKPTESEDACKQRDSPDFASSVIKLNPVGKSTVGTKVIFTVELDQQDYKDINSIEKKALLIVHAKSVSDDMSFVALQVSNSNKVRLLREGRSFEDKVRLSETKYYRYQNNNPNAGIIKIHINQISGLTKILAYRSDDKQSKGQPIKLSPIQPNTIVISEEVTKPIFIQITGLVTSIYTITVSSIHKEHPLSSSLTMAEDVEYQLKLMPYSHTNIELHPIEGQVVFQFSVVGGSIIVCELDMRDMCKAGSEFIGSNGEINIDSSNAREVRLRLGNYVNTTNPNTPKQQNGNKPVGGKTGLETIRTVKVTVLYHATGKQHCEEHKINRLYSKLVKSGSCFKFQIPLAADIQILSSRENLGESQQLYFVCSSKVQPEQSNNRYVIRKGQIEQLCKDFPNDMNLTMILYDPSAHDKQPNQIRMDFSVQYTNDIITLADGVAYYTRTKSLETAIKTFFYEIVDEASGFQIVLMNKKGNQHFFAKIVSNAEKYNIITEADALINSRNSDFYSNPSVQITAQDIAQAKCGRNCMVIISVFSKEKVGGEIEFGIEVIEEEIKLRQGQIRSDFLAKGSVNYYQYSPRLTPTDLLFKISDNNRKCAVSYLSNHPFPSQQNYVAFQNQGSLTYKNAKKGRYYYAIEALEDCPYTISVNEGSSKLTKIEHGQYYDIKMTEGEEKWFYLRHLSTTSFKILSLLKHGLVDIFVNSTDLTKQTIDSISSGKIDKDKFKFKNAYQNALTVSSKSSDFCFGCYYLVYIKAKTISQGSIFLGSESSKIALESGKVLFDEIKYTNLTTLAIFYRVSKGQLSLNVFSGEINVQMTYEEQKFQKVYQTSKTPFNDSYQFTQVQGKYNPIQIKIRAVKGPAIYSFELFPFLENSTKNIKLNPGMKAIATLQNQDPVCFTGTLRSKQEQIYISADNTENFELETLNVQAQLDKKQAKIEKEVVGNVLSIKFNIPEIFFAQAQSYKICIKPPSKIIGFISLSLMQNEKMNLVSPDHMLLIRNEGTFAIHQNGYVIVDLFQCSGKADITYGSDMSELEKKNSRQLDILGISGQNHALRVESQQVLFLKVKLGLGSFLWMPLNQHKQRGIGYYKYAIGKLAYTTGFNTIKFMIGGVFKSKQTNTSVQSVKYNLFISNSREQLQRAVMCQMNRTGNVVSVQINSSKVGDGVAPQIQVNLQKKKINNAFKNDETLYFNVVAQLTLVAPGDDKEHEHYRFVYFEQLVLAELLKQNKIEQQINYNVLIVGAAVVGLCIVGVLCMLVKWVLPAIGRMRSRVLVEDNNQDVEMEAPPSSDRNQMAAGTTERMES